MFDAKKLFIIPLLCSSAAFGASKSVTVAEAEFVDNKSFGTQYNAKVINLKSSKISAQTYGTLKWVSEVGMSVSKGDIIAVISNEEILLQKSEHQQQINGLKLDVKFHQDEYNRLSYLSDESVSRSLIDKQAYKLSLAKSNLTKAQRQLALLNLSINRFEIIAPFSGEVTKRFKSEGEYVELADSILHLSSNNNKQIQFYVPIQKLNSIKKGSEVTIVGYQSKGEIVMLSQSSLNLSGSLEARATCEQCTLVDGMNLKVEVLNHNQKYIDIPLQGLVFREDEVYVYKVKNGVAKKVVINQSVNGQFVDAKNIIEKGDLIIVNGQERLKHGEEVDIDEGATSLL
jgi:membrane fusion protein (multidrug efflux system)